MIRFLDNWDKSNILLLIMSNILLTEFVISPVFKICLSILPFLLLSFLYFNSSKRDVFYVYLIVYTFCYPFGPRDLTSYQNGQLNDYISYTNLNIGFLSLSLFSLLFFTIIECSRIKIIGSFLFKGFIFFGLLFTYSFLNSIANGFYLKFFVSDLKPFLLFFVGIYFGYCLWQRFEVQFEQLFFKVIIVFLIVYAGKTFFYVIYDIFKGNELNNFGTIPYLFLPILFTAIFTVKNGAQRFFMIFAAFISSFSISRGFFIMLGTLGVLVPFFFVERKVAIKIVSSYVLFLGILVFLYSFSSFFLSESAQVFLAYKLNFFSNELGNSEVELNRSTYIRLLEFQNIWFEISRNPFSLLFGKGIGSYFEFKEFPISNSMLGADAFSSDQLEINKFFRPHTFFITGLLKGGIVLVFLFGFYNLRHFFRMAKSFKRSLNDYSYFIVFSGIFTALFFFYYWIPEFLFLNGMILGFYKMKISNGY